MCEVLGFDCDGYEIEEFRVLRFPFSADIDNWEEEVNVDPRFYCIVKRNNGESVLVSIYDDYHSRYIRRYENISFDDKIPMLIKDVALASNFEVAYSGLNKSEWFYDRNREVLKREIEEKLIVKQLTKIKK
jgi:hypothetical protein